MSIPWSWTPGRQLVVPPADEVFSSAQITRMESYSTAQRHLGWASLGVSLAVAGALGLTPLGARLARGLPGPWWLRAVTMTLLALTLGRLATLPFSLQARANAVRYGLTNQSLSEWFRDVGISLLVSWFVAGVLVLTVMICVRRSPRRWPLYAAIAGALLTVLGSWLYPVVVEPLFNRFTALPAGDFRSRIMDLARQEGVPVSEVLVADASRRTTTLNAYVSGFGSTRRVVLYDNLVHDVPRREAMLVVAHELGHARHRDVLVGTALGAIGVGAGAGLLGLVLRSSRLRRRAGIRSPGEPEAVALLLALIAGASLLTSPLQNTLSRAVEARADRDSLMATHDPEAFEKMQRQLALRSLSDPTPPAWSQFWFGSHPTTLQRIGLARTMSSR